MPAKNRYVGCEVCDRELMLYKCKYCGKTFCEEHMAPEKHDCQGLAEYRRQMELGIMAKPGQTAVEDAVDPHDMPSRAGGVIKKGVFAIKLLSVLAVIAASVFAFILLLGYVDSHTPYYSFSIPINNATGATVTLVNYKNATDPTYESLMSFLVADKTIESRYDFPTFTCADFARTLHDNAEAGGIKCGFVAIEFYSTAIDYSIYDNGDGHFSPPVRSTDAGHGVCVFRTTDRGLIYVDASSQSDYAGENPEVRISYIEEGKELNGIDLEWASNTSYAFYESYKKTHLDLIYDQRAYYQDRAKLDAEIAANNGYVTEDMKRKNDGLNGRAIDLNLRKSRLGPFYYPQGIVKNVETYW